MFVRYREIVSLNLRRFKPNELSGAHLDQSDFRETVDEDTVLLDTRNDYSMILVTSKALSALNIRNFREYLNGYAKTKKIHGQKVLVYCTGGVRCEILWLDDP